jgi:hypothetical protein
LRHVWWNFAQRLAALWAVIIVVIAPACAAQDASSPTAFVQQTYARYTDKTREWDTLRADAPSLFDSALLTLIREDQRLAQGEVGALDHDPLCSCQDVDSFKVTAVEVTPQGKGQAKATVRFVNGGQSVQIGLLLTQKAGQWRIGDVQEPAVPSIKSFLTKSIAEARASSGSKSTP